MLSELRVRNLALIESLDLDFDRENSGGLIVMTGETGAGKSIMLRAIHLLSGKRASMDWVRSGAESCEVEALFEVSSAHVSLLTKLEQSGFGGEPTVIIKRSLAANGRSRFYVNGSMANGKLVAELACELLNVASQHDQQQLINSSSHLDFIDTIGDLLVERQELGTMFRSWQRLREEYSQLCAQEREKEQRQDFLRFQLDEIRKAMLQPGEDEQLLAEKRRLKNGQALLQLSQDSYQLLSYELADGLSRLRQNLAQIAAMDGDAVSLAEKISDFTFLGEDFAGLMRDYRDSLQAEPFRLEKVSERLDIIGQMKRKYGESIEDVLAFAEASEQELQRLDSMERELSRMRKELQKQEQELCEAAAQLSAKRREIGLQVEEAMRAELASLAFDRAGFSVAWKDVEQTTANLRATGWDRGEFLFSANHGEPEKPLARIASGGELSRLMLAMKCLLARKDMVETVIFDEIDTGIGGEAAEAVARKIQELAGHHQVFCITHLPQIAARGDLHLQVSKRIDDGRTHSNVVELDKEERVQELMRMLAGDSAGDETLVWARELLKKSEDAGARLHGGVPA